MVNIVSSPSSPPTVLPSSSSSVTAAVSQAGGWVTGLFSGWSMPKITVHLGSSDAGSASTTPSSIPSSTPSPTASLVQSVSSSPTATASPLHPTFQPQESSSPSMENWDMEEITFVEEPQGAFGKTTWKFIIGNDTFTVTNCDSGSGMCIEGTDIDPLSTTDTYVEETPAEINDPSREPSATSTPTNEVVAETSPSATEVPTTSPEASAAVAETPTASPTATPAASPAATSSVTEAPTATNASPVASASPTATPPPAPSEGPGLLSSAWSWATTPVGNIVRVPLSYATSSAKVLAAGSLVGSVATAGASGYGVYRFGKEAISAFESSQQAYIWQEPKARRPLALCAVSTAICAREVLCVGGRLLTGTYV